ncbi:MAG TPA: GNAT family N-acetyltransferase [Elusimicrobia bacterium]|nr:MAG: GNAT family N-acetyltransferase [Elusimicrobia bacterium RIFOXYA12_FULL_49_49]OGS09279.1 MAG: GNAT family N-acetyltransferase [Elusimicrobia bacterium RIFOXYB1_FULL_48_9]OGS15218.1 MAG: GNAT family N-acetyltransferase [Elusimicrobia bacterium RIFOXYA2_FULL_47_53]OGS25927.1 MAG: GNAT family N-acetyltransferase [Elusimicrobia bacterium RIFOXYB12_FULL_50_12]OGS30269.1 MAG: GNAT family N-acetyltransferase [Elusimicrobia bacterium RIFOXYB2_FULL_46_23]HBU70414.1 GNAT family N-acetyltransfera
MIRRCVLKDHKTILSIINDAAMAYKGVIPPDCWHEPYMSPEDLQRDINYGVLFHGYEQDGELVGVMGLQEFTDVTLIRHAYIKTAYRGKGIGSQLLKYLLGLTMKPVLIGTWRDTDWSIIFYEKHGFTVVDRDVADSLLKKYWNVSDRHRESSVVLADPKWMEARGK